MREALLSFAAAAVVFVGLVALDGKVTNWFIPEQADPNTPAFSRLAFMWAIGEWSAARPGERITGYDPRVIDCLSYVMRGEGSGVECGFERVGIE